MNIRPARAQDACRIAEIEIFNYRLYFYPIFKCDAFYFDQLQVTNLCDDFAPDGAYVYDDGVVKGFIRMDGSEIKKLFVEPVLHSQGIGAQLLDYAVNALHADSLWALEKNERALRFYARHGFHPTGERKLEEDTDEYLLLLRRQANVAR